MGRMKPIGRRKIALAIIKVRIAGAWPSLNSGIGDPDVLPMLLAPVSRVQDA